MTPTISSMSIRFSVACSASNQAIGRRASARLAHKLPDDFWDRIGLSQPLHTAELINLHRRPT